MNSRQRLRAVLVAEIEGMRNAAEDFYDAEEPQSAEEIERLHVLEQGVAVLKEAVDGLDSLDGGVVPEIFKRKKGLHGIDSARARTCRTEIASYVDVLHKIGLSSSQEAAIGLVADELAVSNETVESWPDQARQSDSVRLEDLVTEQVMLYKYNVFHSLGSKSHPMSGEQVIEKILSQVRRAGDALEKAKKPKSAKMEEARRQKIKK
jgi:hypothetical protein